MKFLFVIAISIFFVACNSSTEYQSVSKEVAMQNDTFLSSYGIYALDGESLMEAQAFDTIAAKLLPSYQKMKQQRDTTVATGYFIENVTSLRGILSPPSPEYLSLYGKGIDAEEKTALAACTQVFMMTFQGTSTHVYREQAKLIRFIDALMTNKKYVIVDFGTLEYFNAATWKTRRVAQLSDTVFNVVDQVLIKVLNIDSTHCRAVTFGMDKFCLPDFSITGFPCEEAKNYTRLLMATAQQASEKKVFAGDSTFALNLSKIGNKRWNAYFAKINNQKGKSAVLELKNIPPVYGDKNNVQYAINATNFKELFASTFKEQESVNYVAHDKKILAISEQAKKMLPSLKDRFNTKKLVEDLLFVKAPFQTNTEHKEWMWVKVTGWDDHTISGTLYSSSAKSEHLKEGIVVSVKETEVFDYIIKKEDGTFEGNETERHMLQKRIPEATKSK